MILLRIPLRIVRAVGFVAFFLWELAVANAVVAWEVITPGSSIRSGIIEVPIRSRRSIEVVLLANLISLTPGTLSLEVAADRSSLFVHALHIVSPAHMRIRVRRLEDRLLRVLR